MTGARNQSSSPFSVMERASSRFATLSLDAGGKIVEFAGIEVPALCLGPSVTGKSVLDLWQDWPPLKSFAERALSGALASATVQVTPPDGSGRSGLHRLFSFPVAGGVSSVTTLLAFAVPTPRSRGMVQLS